MRRIDPIALVLMLLTALPALAHDGGFGHSRRTIWVGAGPDGLLVEYRITQNADEALLELAQMDADGDGQISADEKERHFAEAAKHLSQRLSFETSTGAELPARFVRYRLDNSLTQTFCFSVPSHEAEIHLEDGLFPHKPGQVRVVTGPGVTAELSHAPNLTHVDWLSLKIMRSK